MTCIVLPHDRLRTVIPDTYTTTSNRPLVHIESSEEKMTLVPNEKDRFKRKLSCRSCFNAMDLIRERLKGDNGSVHLSDIVTAFKEYNVKEKGKGNMTLKLTLLYVLYGVLLVSWPAKKLDDQYIYLVDNLKAFNAYPWGRIAYEYLMSDIRTYMSDRVNVVNRLKPSRAEKSSGYFQSVAKWQRKWWQPFHRMKMSLDEDVDVEAETPRMMKTWEGRPKKITMWMLKSHLFMDLFDLHQIEKISKQIDKIEEKMMTLKSILSAMMEMVGCKVVENDDEKDGEKSVGESDEGRE
ncbi:hypothetical protein DH2020_017788 [Rehmannia glutinosa]|uniref:DUF1985 domain-containing protein n=1 Tax=Rehmannia glutinosa TaxID=99300 RepID=A0ABR0WJ19_REHGL